VESFIAAFATLFQWHNFIALLIGVMGGMVFGVLPGIGGGELMAVLIPLTWKMDVTTAFSLLIGIYATSKFGGSLTAILFNVPGDNPNAATLLDGFPMARQGKARTAIAASAVVSILGGWVSALTIVAFLPVMYWLILHLGPAEYFLLALFGLTAIAAVSAKSLTKGLISGGIGIMISTIGYHPLVGKPRFAMGSYFLQDGIQMVTVVIGTLAMSQAIALLMEGSPIAAKGVKLTGSIWEGVAACFKHFGVFVRSSLIAIVVGIAPGAGATVAAFLAYASAVKASKNPENFGKGDIRGVIAAETATNACQGGDLVPTLILGIPGSKACAILLGAFIIHGISPGPQLVKTRPDIIYLIIAGLVLAHFICVGISIFFVGAMEKLTTTRAEILSPIIIVFCLIGSYVIREYPQDMLITVIFGIVGYLMQKYGYHPIPMVLGLILGPIAEFGFFQALRYSDNGFWVFFTRPQSVVLIILTLIPVLWPIVKSQKARMKKKMVLKKA